MNSNEAISLRHQLMMARNELNKLRQQIRNLQYTQKKDVNEIVGLVKSYRCENCHVYKESDTGKAHDSISPGAEMSLALPLTLSSDLALNAVNAEGAQHQQRSQQKQGKPFQLIAKETVFRTIGVIRTCFPEKRAVPRQTNVGNRLKATIELFPDLFTNNDHALDGLEDYSHLWIIYHFHRNTSHPKAKVAPPRLSGQRIGVFATRSPHRPSPIGLSLVEIDRIDGATISFFGTDMIDGTPVLDIKPYIPLYDTPLPVTAERINSFDSTDNGSDFYELRQEPDGEESDMELSVGTVATVSSLQTDLMDHPVTRTLGIRVPPWVQMPPSSSTSSSSATSNNSTFSALKSVVFSEHSEHQLQQLGLAKECIVNILEADPRSVYVRTKYRNQNYTFQLNESTVTCKFNDDLNQVTVLQILPTIDTSVNGPVHQNGGQMDEEEGQHGESNNVQLKCTIANSK